MSKNLLIYLIVQFLFVSITKCDDLLHTCIDKYGAYTNPSPYKVDLDTLLTTINSENKTTYGFYNTSVGNSIYGVALCKGDTTAQECQDCLINITSTLPPLCPTQNEAVGWYDDCMLHYSSRDLRGVAEVNPVVYANDTTKVSDGLTGDFNQALGELLSRVQNEAASGDSRLKFATGEANYAHYFNKIYALAQCMPDISFESCFNCLGTYIAMFPNCCNNSKGASANGPSCRIAYNSQLFYKLSNSSSKSSERNISYYLIRLGLPIFLIMLVIVIIIVYMKRARRHGQDKTPTLTLGSSPIHPQPQREPSTKIARHPSTKIARHPSKIKEDSKTTTKRSEPLQYDLETLKLATNGFDDAKILGRGGFGFVYEGLLQDGERVAVKRLAGGSTQGDAEFANEVRYLAEVRHKNLVTLLGYCSENGEKLLVYEFVLNSSLEKFLGGSNKLPWGTRFKIIMGVGEGLSYLHRDNYHFREGIIHRDLKPQNILIDEDMKPKIADFGMARLVELNKTTEFTNIIVGTPGYIAPEYFETGQVSAKIDVYSFGVMLLEIVTRKSNSPFHAKQHPRQLNLINQAWLIWKAKSPMELVDPSLDDAYSKAEFLRCVQVGLMCVQENALDRPKMSDVVDMLRKGTNLEFLKEIEPPTAALHQSGRPRYESLLSESGEYLN